MCGRYTLRANPKLVAEEFGLFDTPDLSPRFNIAPTQSVPVVRLLPGEERRHLVFLRWGLIPSWADDIAIGNRSINARSETAASKPTFRKAFRSRRCLIVADGFYEWLKTGKHKQPYCIQLKSQRPFAMAGLWEQWHKQDQPIESCTILTTDANELVAPIHDRMPVILRPEDYAAWLDPACQDVDKLQLMLKPFAAGLMTLEPVGDPASRAP